MDDGDRRGGHRRVGGAVALLVALTSAPSLAQEFDLIGTRATGMAGAFVAVADDATAAYWNPGGLPTGAFLSLLVDHLTRDTRADPAHPDSSGTGQAGTVLAMSTNTAAFSYYRLRINQIERQSVAEDPSDPARKDHQGAPVLRSLVTHNVAVTGAQLVYPGISVGSTVRYVRGSYGVGLGQPGVTTETWLQQAGDLERRGQNEVDLDVGLKAGGSRLQVGLVARNLLEPSFGGSDESRIRLRRHYRAGVAVRPAAGLVVATDVDLSRVSTPHGDHRTLAVGAEQWFGLWLALRGGARFNLEGADGDRRPVGAFGLSLALTAGVYIDGQLTRGRDDGERGWSVAGRIGF